ncbi:MAG TPA: FRG domain-containing protein, partial [Coriobacteriia bacterium]
GFPSPLLDWTQSPFVAAYFAFYEIPTGTDRVVVNAYVEAPHGAKLASIAEPTIYKTSATATTDRRHFMQQAVYTVAAEQVDGNRMQFCPHARVFERDHPAQDLLYRITLPATERRAALRDLARSNINHFTLFQDEDALVRSLAMKTFDLQEHPA